MSLMHGPNMPPEMRHEEMLRGKEIELNERLGQMEKELNAARKRKKQLMNKQKTVSFGN